MPSAAERVSGGRFLCGPKTTTGYPLPTLRVGLAGRTGGENLTRGRAGKGESKLDATLPAVHPEEICLAPGSRARYRKALTAE